MISSDHSIRIHVSYVSSQPSLSRCVRSGHSLSKSFTLEAVKAILQFWIPFCNETMVPEAGHALDLTKTKFPASQRKLCQDILKLRSLLRSNDHDELPTSALFGLHDVVHISFPMFSLSLPLFRDALGDDIIYIETP